MKRKKRNAEYFQNVNRAMKEQVQCWSFIGSYDMPRMDNQLDKAQKRIWRKKSKGE